MTCRTVHAQCTRSASAVHAQCMRSARYMMMMMKDTKQASVSAAVYAVTKKNLTVTAFAFAASAFTFAASAFAG